MDNVKVSCAEPIRLNCPHNFPDYVNEIDRIFRAEGCEIYLVGGSVRDLLLGREPDDHDFALSADAEEIIRICRKYGLDYDDQYRSINYIVVRMGDDKIDLDTFAGGSIRSDMLRRDLTMNALAYDVAAQEIIDYTGGIEDLNNRLIRVTNISSLGEQPKVTLRALRFSIEYGFRIDNESYQAMMDNTDSFAEIRTSSLIKCMTKLLRDGRDFFVEGRLNG